MFCFQESPPKGDDPFLLLAKSSSATSTANDAPTVPPMIPYSVPFERGRDEYENRARKAPVLPYFLPPGSPPVHHQSPADTLPVPPGEADFFCILADSSMLPGRNTGSSVCLCSNRGEISLSNTASTSRRVFFPSNVILRFAHDRLTFC